MTETRNLRGATVLALLPEFMRADLIEDQAFLDAIDVEAETTLSFSDEGLAVSADAFFAGVDALYATPGAPQTVTAKDGNTIVLSIEADDADIMTIRIGERDHKVLGHPEMGRDRDRRLSGFDRMIAGRGLPATERQIWQERLRERPASALEAKELERRLSLSPPAVAHALEDELEAGRGSIETMVPAAEAYYMALVGGGAPGSLDEMARHVADDLIPGLLGWSQRGGAIRALALSSHERLLALADWSCLSEDDTRALIVWARSKGDPFSQIGVIHIALLNGRAASLQPELTELIGDICAHDPADPNSRLSLFQSSVIAIEAQLSRQHLLSTWPPFRRRAAAFAQAALFTQRAIGKIQIEPFARWALDTGGQEFWARTQVDLTREPRWLPEFITLPQLRAELLGRLHALGGRYGEDLPEGPLRATLTAPDGIVRSATQFPQSFRAGPLEGAYPGDVGQPPPDLSAYLDELLATETLTFSVLAGLANLVALFQTDHVRIEKAVKLIKSSGHRVQGDHPPEALEGLLDALADAACMARAPGLAEQVRILCRRRRADAVTAPPVFREAAWALSASAAYDDFGARAEFAGAWITELAFVVEDRQDARNLRDILDILCRAEPRFRISLGRAVAALDVYIRS